MSFLAILEQRLGKFPGAGNREVGGPEQRLSNAKQAIKTAHRRALSHINRRAVCHAIAAIFAVFKPANDGFGSKPTRPEPAPTHARGGAGTGRLRLSSVEVADAVACGVVRWKRGLRLAALQNTHAREKNAWLRILARWLSLPALRPGSATNWRNAARENGFDLLIAADEPRIAEAADDFRKLGATVEAVQADLATLAGVEQLDLALKRLDRPVDALLANAGRGLGKAFLDQDFPDIMRVVNTNITGTLYLLHKIGRDMRARGEGQILIVGSIAGFMPGTYQAVYNGTKAFLDSFAFALRHELRDSEAAAASP